MFTAKTFAHFKTMATMATRSETAKVSAGGAASSARHKDSRKVRATLHLPSQYCEYQTEKAMG
jgi:hypothetical protein